MSINSCLYGKLHISALWEKTVFLVCFLWYTKQKQHLHCCKVLKDEKKVCKNFLKDWINCMMHDTTHIALPFWIITAYNVDKGEWQSFRIKLVQNTNIRAFKEWKMRINIMNKGHILKWMWLKPTKANVKMVYIYIYIYEIYFF